MCTLLMTFSVILGFTFCIIIMMFYPFIVNFLRWFLRSLGNISKFFVLTVRGSISLLLFVTFSPHCTLSQQSCPHTPAQNGVAERKHRHILETDRALLLSASVPRHFWAEAIMTSVYLISRTPSTVLSGVTPFERLRS